LNLEHVLRNNRDAGKKLLVPYVMAGMSHDWLDVVRSIALSGADAIELGIPFSDPMIDGPVIQQASKIALELGTTPESVLSELAHVDVGVPLVVMTYYNLVFRAGHHRFAHRLAESGVAGASFPTCHSTKRRSGARKQTLLVCRQCCWWRRALQTNARRGSAPARAVSSTASRPWV